MVIQNHLFEQLKAESAEITDILDSYAELESVYLGSVVAMGVMPEPVNDFKNTSSVTLEFHDASTARVSTTGGARRSTDR